MLNLNGVACVNLVMLVGDAKNSNFSSTGVLNNDNRSLLLQGLGDDTHPTDAFLSDKARHCLHALSHGYVKVEEMFATFYRLSSNGYPDNNRKAMLTESILPLSNCRDNYF